MAIGVATPPRLIAKGALIRSSRLPRDPDKEEIGRSLVFELDNSQIRATAWNREFPQGLPISVGEVGAFVFEVSEGSGRTDLNLVRLVTGDDLNALAQAAGLK